MWAHTILGISVAAAAVAASCVFIGADDTPPYQPCTSDSECRWNLGCYDVVIDYGDALATRRMCTRACEDSDECPAGGACADAADGPPLCYRRCGSDLDCAPGFACVADVADRVYDAMCLPWAGPPAVGYAAR